MNLRWLIWDYVDPSVEVDRKTRRQVRVQAFRGMRSGHATSPVEEHGRIRSLQLLQALIPGAVMLGVFATKFLVGGPWWVIAPMVIVQLVISLGLMGLVNGFLLRTYVYESLRQRGYDVCMVCGYRLEGRPSTADKCPECGTETVEALAPEVDELGRLK